MKSRPTYHFRKKRHRRRNRYLKVLGITLLLAIVAGLIFLYDLLQNQVTEIEGSPSVVTQSTQSGAYQTLNEPTFSIELPADWKETDRFNRTYQAGVTWQSTRDKESDRWLTVYVDKIPTNYPVNYIVPVEAADGGYLKLGNLSDQCSTFTQGGTVQPRDTLPNEPVLAQWEEVDFLCNLPRPFEHEIGTSSESAINSVAVKGTKQGEHKYFFLYTDHNNSVNNQIFIDALKTFQAK